MSIKCPQCRHDNPDDSIFCEDCGFKLQVAAAPAPPVAPPVPPPAAVPRVLYKLSFKGNVFEVSETARTFGRQDFIRHIPDTEYKFISRKHFTITKENGKFYVRDEGTANGTKLNGAEISGAGKKELKDGDKITVADTVELQFNIER
jgi:pSer/pThr/pTyr-binding forkhead associated (FHA) protein